MFSANTIEAWPAKIFLIFISGACNVCCSEPANFRSTNYGELCDFLKIRKFENFDSKTHLRHRSSILKVIFKSRPSIGGGG